MASQKRSYSLGRASSSRTPLARPTSAGWSAVGKLSDGPKYREAADYLMEKPHNQAANGRTGCPHVSSKQGPIPGTNRAHHTMTIETPGGGKDQQILDSHSDIFYVLGLPLSVWPTSFQFFFLMGSIFFFFLIYGYCQELIFSFEAFKAYGWYLTLTQFGCYTVFGLVATRVQSDNTRRIPLQTYILLSILTVVTMGMSNASLGYLNYPTQVIFKCCKLIPVMIGGVLIQGKPYGLTDTAAALCMSVGLIFFTLADSTVSPQFDSTGVLLISLALCADAVIGNVQEKAMKAHRASSSEVCYCPCRWVSQKWSAPCPKCQTEIIAIMYISCERYSIRIVLDFSYFSLDLSYMAVFSTHSGFAISILYRPMSMLFCSHYLDTWALYLSLP